VHDERRADRFCFALENVVRRVRHNDRDQIRPLVFRDEYQVEPVIVAEPQIGDQQSELGGESLTRGDNEFRPRRTRPLPSRL
jgi:hypothetical protein